MKTALIARRRRQGGGALFAIWLDDVEAAHGTAMTAVDFSAVLRSGPYSLADEYDALIDGLTLNTTTGVLSGTPTDRRGRGWHEIRVQDAVGNIARMRMCSVPDINPANYATAYDGTVINTEQTVSGGTGDLLLANLEINDRLNIHSWTGGIITIYNPTVDTEVAANDGIRVSTSGDAENLTIYGGTFSTGLNGIIVAEDSGSGVTHPGLRILNTRMIATGLSEGPTNKHGVYNQAPDALLEGNSFGPDTDHPSATGMHWGSGISTRSGSVVRGNRIRECKNDGIGYFADHPGAGTSLLIEQNDIDDINLSDTGRNAINLIALNAGASPPAVAANLIDDATIRNNLLGEGNSVQVAADYATEGVTVTQSNNQAVSQAPTEVWPPVITPDAWFDFVTGEGYWNGAARTISDFGLNSGDSYGVTFGDMGIPTGNDYSMMVETEYGGAFNASSATFAQMYVLRTGSDRASIEGRETTGRVDVAFPYGSGALPLVEATGIVRTGLTTKIGDPLSYNNSRSEMRFFSQDTTSATIPISTQHLFINATPDVTATNFNLLNTTGLPIRRFAFWATPLTDQQLYDLNRFDRHGVYFSGDSFISNGNIAGEFLKAIEAAGHGPVGIVADGVGGEALPDHVIRHTARPTSWGDCLFIVDGGFDTVSGLTASTDAIDTYVSNLGHDRWALVEPNPLNPLGDSRRDEWNDFFYGHEGNTGARALYNYVGPEHYVKTYDTMLANGDGSSTDNDLIAQGKWPLNVTYDGTHPNALGDELFGGLMAAHAIAKKWV